MLHDLYGSASWHGMHMPWLSNAKYVKTASRAAKLHITPAIHTLIASPKVHRRMYQAAKPLVALLALPRPPSASSLNASRRSMIYAFSSRNLQSKSHINQKHTNRA